MIKKKHEEEKFIMMLKRFLSTVAHVYIHLYRPTAHFYHQVLFFFYIKVCFYT